MYNNIYKKYYLASFGINKDSIKSRIKTCIKILFKLEKENEILLYHNLAIETHYWICKRALNIINRL